jgi:hypothetical protein
MMRVGSMFCIDKEVKDEDNRYLLYRFDNGFIHRTVAERLQSGTHGSSAKHAERIQ